MGGIPTNLNCEVVDSSQETVVKGLMAVGEAACVSVHGANRLGTNSLLDLIVFGRKAAARAKEIIDPQAPHIQYSKTNLQAIAEWFQNIHQSTGKQSVHELRTCLQQTMQHHFAVFREQKSLEEGVNKLIDIEKKLTELELRDKSLVWNTELVEAIELNNLYLQAFATAHSALYRTESRGAHARDDYPERNDKEWLVHTLCSKKGVQPHFDRRPVHLYTMIEDLAPIAPAKRTY